MSKSEFTNDEASYGKNSEAGTEQIGHHWAIGGILWLWSTLHRLAAPLSFDFWAKSALSLCRKQRRDETSDFLGYSAGFGIPNSRKPLASVNSYLLGGLPTLGGPALRAVVDAYFSKAPFLNPCIEAGIGVISRLRHDSKGWDNPPPVSLWRR